MRGAAHYTQTNTAICASRRSFDYEDFFGAGATFAEYEDFFCASRRSLDYEDFFGAGATFAEYEDFFCASRRSFDYEDFFGAGATFAEYEDFFLRERRVRRIKDFWMRGLIFLAGSVVGGLALAFILVMVRPELIRRGGAPVPLTLLAGPRPTEPAPARVTYSAAVQRAAPSVVNVYTARLVTERVAPSSLGELFGGFLPRYRQRIERSLGSGVIVDDAGHIVTNHHVIANADSVRVQLADGRVADAHIVGRDPDTDLAVLKIDLTPLPIAVLGRSDQLKVGDVVLAIGNPVGLSQTVTHGIVSATSRQQLGIAALEDFIQTDAPINFGNSGGALVDSSGALVGINTAIVAKNLGVEGIGFAIPVNMVRGVLSDIIANGRVIRGWIGIVPEDVSNEQAAQYGLAQGGVLVANLYVGSPAQQAGLQPGDLILAIDGVPVRGAQDTLGHIATHKPGSRIAIHGTRGGHEFDVHAQVTERPRNN